MKFSDIASRAGKFAADNSPTILTAVGVTGVITTAYLSGKASFKASEILRDERKRVNATRSTPQIVMVSNREKLELVWKLYIPAVASGVLSCTAIVCANRVGTRRAAAMAAAYTISERAMEEYRHKVVEKIGENKEREIRDELAQDRINRNPVGDSQVIVTGGGESLFYDSFTGRYFESDMENVKHAFNRMNHKLINSQYASLNDFYDMIGLNRLDMGEEVGWNADRLIEPKFSATITDDNRPAIVLDFSVAPVRGYFRAHAQ